MKHWYEMQTNEAQGKKRGIDFLSDELSYLLGKLVKFKGGNVVLPRQARIRFDGTINE